MRETKFRLWVEGEGDEPYFEERFVVHPDGVASYLDEWGYMCGYCKTTKITLMQSIGLQDLNGVDIYEGDILRERLTYNPNDGKNYLSWEVFFHDNDCAPQGTTGYKIGRAVGHGSVVGGAAGYPTLPKYTKELIVVGNIYENKELLDD